MKFAERVKAFLAKSLTGGEGKESDEDEEADLENEDETGGETGDETEGGGSGETKGKKKGEDMEDATDILKGLVKELKDINKSIKALSENQKILEKSQNDVGEAVVSVSELVAKIAGIPVSPKSVMAKGNLGGAAPRQAAQPVVAPTQAEFEQAQDILVKAVAAGEITLLKSEMISSGMQKAMAIPGYRMKPEDYEFLARKMQAA